MACPTLRGSAVESVAWKRWRIWNCSCAEVTRSGWNLRSNTEFLPAVNEIGDDVECIQSAFDVRPLGLKNCDRACVCYKESHSQQCLCCETDLWMSERFRDWSDAPSEHPWSWFWGKKTRPTWPCEGETFDCCCVPVSGAIIDMDCSAHDAASC